MAEQTAEAFSPVEDDRFRKCNTCGLIAAVGRHGMVDCVAELKRQISNLRKEKMEFQINLGMARDDLAALEKVFRETFDD